MVTGFIILCIGSMIMRQERTGPNGRESAHSYGRMVLLHDGTNKTHSRTMNEIIHHLAGFFFFFWFKCCECNRMCTRERLVFELTYQFGNHATRQLQLGSCSGLGHSREWNECDANNGFKRPELRVELPLWEIFLKSRESSNGQRN